MLNVSLIVFKRLMKQMLMALIEFLLNRFANESWMLITIIKSKKIEETFILKQHTIYTKVEIIPYIFDFNILHYREETLF